MNIMNGSTDTLKIINNEQPTAVTVHFLNFAICVNSGTV